MNAGSAKQRAAVNLALTGVQKNLVHIKKVLGNWKLAG